MIQSVIHMMDAILFIMLMKVRLHIQLITSFQILELTLMSRIPKQVYHNRNQHLSIPHGLQLSNIQMVSIKTTQYQTSELITISLPPPLVLKLLRPSPTISGIGNLNQQRISFWIKVFHHSKLIKSLLLFSMKILKLLC